MRQHRRLRDKLLISFLGLLGTFLFIALQPAHAVDGDVSTDGTIALTAESSDEVAATPLLEKTIITQTEETPIEEPARTIRLTKIMIESEKGEPVIRLALTGKASSTLEYLSNPERALLKIRNTLLVSKTSTVTAKQSPVQRVRSAQHDQDVWVVVDLDKSTNWVRETNRQGITLRLSGLGTSKSEKPGAPTPVPEKASVPQVALTHAGLANYQVVDIAAQDQGDKTRITLTTDGQARYRVEREKQGTQFVLKIYGAALIWKDKLTRLPMGAVRDLSARQKMEAGESVVQVNILLSEAVPYLVFKDQNQVVLEFNNPGTLTPSGQRGNLNATVSVDLQNADLHAVLRALASDVGFDMVLTPGMEKTEGALAQVTLSINEQPIKTVLDFILRPRQMAYAVSGNTLRIGLASEFPLETEVFTLKNLEVNNSHIQESIEAAFTEGNKGKVVLEPASNRIIVSAIPSDMVRAQEIVRQMDVEKRLVTRTIILSYNQVEKVIPLVQPMLSSLGSVKQNSSENAVVVSDIPGNVAYIAKMISSLDTKSQQVMIEARIVEVSRTNQQDLGVNWTARTDDVNANPQVTARVNPARVGTVGQLSIGTLQSGIDLSATLSALESKGKVNTISNPRIATLNNNSATLTASQSIPYATSTVSNGVVSNVVNYLELPINLTVTPQITRDGQVMLNPMTLTVTTVVGEGNPPRTSTRAASTQMVVDDGETIAIGGMVRDEEITRESKVPLLGDIPLLGFLFRSNITTKNKVELVVFLTTHILE